MFERSKTKSLGWLAYMLAGAFLLSSSGCRSLPPPEQELSYPSYLTLKPTDRLLVLAPHPDDEVLGCGGVIQEAVSQGLPVRVVFLTYGDNNELSFIRYRKRPVLMPKAVRAMGELRHEEALKAADLLGLSRSQLTFLGYPDWGTFPIWCLHWGSRPAYRSMLTHVRAVPYPDAFRPGAPYKAEAVLADLESLLREFKPTKVFVSHPADSHPDHRACYLYTRVALWDLQQELRPKLYPYLVHYSRWPRPDKDPLHQTLVPPPSLNQLLWRSYPLSSEQATRNLEALKAHASQYRFSPRSMANLIRLNELFGDYYSVALRGPESGLVQDPSLLLDEIPENLSKEEQAAFVRVEWRSVRIEGTDLVLTLEFSKPLAKEVSASIYLFGYRVGRPFSEMPKLHIRVGLFRYQVYDQNRRLSAKTVSILRNRKRITVRVPLEALGNPQKILSSAHTTLGEISLDWASWRVLELTD